MPFASHRNISIMLVELFQVSRIKSSKHTKPDSSLAESFESGYVKTELMFYAVFYKFGRTVREGVLLFVVYFK